MRPVWKESATSAHTPLPSLTSFPIGATNIACPQGQSPASISLALHLTEMQKAMASGQGRTFGRCAFPLYLVNLCTQACSRSFY